MTAAETIRVAAVLDATGCAADRHAQALAAFLRDGLRLPAGRRAETSAILVCADEAHCESLAARTPARDVRLIRVEPHRPDLLVSALAAREAGEGADLYVFPGGSLGIESAARLAARTGGSALTNVTHAGLDADVLTCRRAAYSGHVTGIFTLGSRPWCIGLDPAWADARPDDDPAGVPPKAAQGQAVHTDQVVRTLADLTGDRASPPLVDVEPLETPQTGDLQAARFLVVAGRGAGSRDGVDRIAAAAARMGAAIGVTRPVAMNAWAPPDRQIGVSGTRAAPAVCVIAGASGAPAFLWGVERAGFIAAVDTDDRAPIAGEADAVVVDDAVAVIEALADVVTRDRP